MCEGVRAVRRASPERTSLSAWWQHCWAAVLQAQKAHHKRGPIPLKAFGSRFSTLPHSSLPPSLPAGGGIRCSRRRSLAWEGSRVEADPPGLDCQSEPRAGLRPRDRPSPGPAPRPHGFLPLAPPAVHHPCFPTPSS